MNAVNSILQPEQRQSIDAILKTHGDLDYKWIDPQKIVVAQWVRMKCMFGCGEYGRGGACPPNTPSVAECERFFHEYRDTIILHFEGRMEKPEDWHAWSAKINARLVKLERAFLLFMDAQRLHWPARNLRAATHGPAIAGGDGGECLRHGAGIRFRHQRAQGLRPEN